MNEKQITTLRVLKGMVSDSRRKMEQVANQLISSGFGRTYEALERVIREVERWERTNHE